jgi:nucleoside-diphosphate-sugar epimerase
MGEVLMVGYGDIAKRAAARLAPGVRLHILSRSRGADLDRPGTLAAALELARGATALLHCAPPPPSGEADPRTAQLLAALERARIIPARLVYISTSGVYGDCAGERVAETRAVDPQTPRARRRVDAERALAAWCARHGAALVVLRAPGIYALERLPLERLRRGTPVLREADDVYTNHIHADDLAGAALRALEPDAPAGVYNASDDSEMKMGEWFDLVADRARLPRPPRIARAEAPGRIPQELRSFLSESRRLDNRRLKDALGVRLRYPRVHDLLAPSRKVAQ